MSKILVNRRGVMISRRGCRVEEPRKWELDAGSGSVVRLALEDLWALHHALGRELERASRGDVNQQPDEEEST